MAEDIARMNPVSPHDSIQWADNDVFSKAMGRLEYLGCVRGTGLGPLPLRSTCHSFTSASRLSQDFALVSRMNSMTVQMQEEKRIMNERMAAQDQVIADMKKIIESFAASNAEAGNTSIAQDTGSPGVVKVRSLASSRPS
jgi:hypothetical protein